MKAGGSVCTQGALSPLATGAIAASFPVDGSKRGPWSLLRSHMDELRLSASGHRVHLFEHSDYSGGQAQYGERHAFRASIQKESLNHPHPAPCLADD
jgi:hypothetical protein